MKTIVTHSDNFHPDEIFAVATLLLIYPEAIVVRSRESADWEKADIVVDVGGVYDPSKNKFDHHQPGGAGKRGNGIPFASFGLIWKHFGEKLVDIEEQEIIDSRLVVPIDAIDNGINLSTPSFEEIREYSIQDFLFSYVDSSRTDTKYLFETFMKLVNISKDLLVREIDSAKKVATGMKKVREIVEQTEEKQIIVFPEDLPWDRVLADIPEVLYVVYPRKNGSWGVKSIRKKLGGFELRKPLPEAWLGKEGDALVEITGVPDALFMHKGRFLASAQSKEGAIKLAQIALNA
ncbi:MAG: MYG1 family protein [Minisyncoccota bacterium]